MTTQIINKPNYCQYSWLVETMGDKPIPDNDNKPGSVTSEPVDPDDNKYGNNYYGD